MGRYILGIDLGTTTGVCRHFVDGSAVVHHVKHKSELAGRVLGVSGIIKQHVTPDCIGVCIEQPFGANARSLQALYAMMGAAVLECENQGVPWSLVHLAKVKQNATGKGNAKKEDMQKAAKERWGQDMSEDEADAAWVAAYAMDSGLFD